MRNPTVAFWISVTFFCSSAVGQDPLRTAEGLEKKADKLIQVRLDDATDAQESELLKLWKVMPQDAKYLRGLFDRKEFQKPPKGYVADLQESSDALDRVFDPNTRLTAAEKLEICSSVSDDLKAKRSFAEKNADNPFASVKVTVTTRRGEAEVKGLLVWYVPRFSAANEKRHKRFAEVSSPTECDLLPGCYVMWTVDAENKGARQIIDVGKTGKAVLKVDLPAPPVK